MTRYVNLRVSDAEDRHHVQGAEREREHADIRNVEGERQRESVDTSVDVGMRGRPKRIR